MTYRDPEPTPNDIAPDIGEDTSRGSSGWEKARRLRANCNTRRETCEDASTGPHCYHFGDRGGTCCRCKCRGQMDF